MSTPSLGRYWPPRLAASSSWYPTPSPVSKASASNWPGNVIVCAWTRGAKQTMAIDAVSAHESAFEMKRGRDVVVALVIMGDLLSVSERRPLDPELLHAELQRAAIDAEALGGAARTRQHPAGLFQRGENVSALGLFERDLSGTHRHAADPIGDRRHRDVQPLPARADDRAL